MREYLTFKASNYYFKINSPCEEYVNYLINEKGNHMSYYDIVVNFPQRTPIYKILPSEIREDKLTLNLLQYIHMKNEDNKIYRSMSMERDLFLKVIFDTFCVNMVKSMILMSQESKVKHLKIMPEDKVKKAKEIIEKQ
jgi:hypothetical protein